MNKSNSNSLLPNIPSNIAMHNSRQSLANTPEKSKTEHANKKKETISKAEEMSNMGGIKLSMPPIKNNVAGSVYQKNSHGNEFNLTKVISTSPSVTRL